MEPNRPVVLVDGIPVLERPARDDLRAQGIECLYAADQRVIKDGAGNVKMTIVKVELCIPGSVEVTRGPRVAVSHPGAVKVHPSFNPEYPPRPPLASAPPLGGGASNPGVSVIALASPGAPAVFGGYGSAGAAPARIEPLPNGHPANDGGEEEPDLPARPYYRNEWRPDWKVGFGPQKGMTLGQILRDHGTNALTFYYWRGQKQVSDNRDPNNPNRQERYAAVNESMCDYIMRLWKGAGIDGPLPAPPARPGRRNGGRR